jgi:formylglycine-generating enzyme required for sulfatase activity
LADKIDLFGWSGKDSNVPFGISTSINNTDYAGEFVDWGINWIGGDMPNTWRTLSIDEWKYLYHERNHADKLFALGTINGIAGMILLPDDWQLPEGVTCKLPTEEGLLWDENYNGGGYVNTNTQANYYQDNIYTIDQWQVMEEVGAVFLPAAGYREKINFSNKSVNPPSDHVGSYATNTISDQNNYYFMRFIHREVRKYAHSLYRGRSVRLVHDTIPPVLTFTVNGVSFNMIYVEGGSFMMGSEAANAEEDEKPIHEVTLSDFYIGEMEVTQQLWQLVMGNNPSVKEGNNLPVTNISWGDCQTFVEKLSEMTGMHFRLPTEAEWEYAARGGQKSKGYTYAGSDAIDEVAWYKENSNNQTHAVGQKQPNELGIYDMTGNVWEYCYDWHSLYTDQAQTNPMGATTGEKRVLRGGCYHYDSKNCTNTNRHSYYTPDNGGASTGLRIVLEMEK